jgi:hypothetical protein
MPIDPIDKSYLVRFYHTPPDLGVIALMTKFKPEMLHRGQQRNDSEIGAGMTVFIM